jgi:hypothetical protein|nr:MAG TPA: Protein of unknown function (DUF2577) [Caudoviricetes sp.]
MSFADELIDIIKSNNNVYTTQVIAKVETPPPNLTLKFSEQLIPAEQIYCSNYLLPHYHRNYKLDGIIDNVEINVSEYSFNNSTSTEVASNHSHPVKSLSGKGNYKGSGTYQSHKDIWFEDTLKTGDEVLVNIVGVFWVVVSKITKMPSEAIEGV